MNRKNLGRPLERSYRQRKKSLKVLGFASYPAYLRSELWKGIRAAVLEANDRCIRCGEPADAVHHAFYTVAVLAGRDMSKLYSVCGDCHLKAEKDHTGKKTTLGRANRFLDIIDRKGKWTGKENAYVPRKVPKFRRRF